MPINIICLALLIIVLLILSLRERIRRRTITSKSWGDVLGEHSRSPLGDALAQVVGVAGGIYLSVVMLANFLELNVPSRVELMGIGIEPLASISILIALVQPFVLRLLGR